MGNLTVQRGNLSLQYGNFSIYNGAVTWTSKINTDNSYSIGNGTVDFKVSSSGLSNTNGGVTWSQSTDSSGRYVFTDASANIQFFGSTITCIPATTADAKIELGFGRAGTGYAYIDLVGDTTYTDYGSRFMRGNAGANATTTLEHRGTGNFQLIATEAADLSFLTTNTIRMLIKAGGNVAIGSTTDTLNRVLGVTGIAQVTDRLRLASSSTATVDASFVIDAALGGSNRITQWTGSGTIALNNMYNGTNWYSWGVDSSNRWNITPNATIFGTTGLMMNTTGDIGISIASDTNYKLLVSGNAKLNAPTALGGVGITFADGSKQVYSEEPGGSSTYTFDGFESSTKFYFNGDSLTNIVDSAALTLTGGASLSSTVKRSGTTSLYVPTQNTGGVSFAQTSTDYQLSGVDWTFETWLYMPDVTSGTWIIPLIATSNYSIAAGSGFSIRLDGNSGSATLGINVGRSTGSYVSSSMSISQNAWNHFAVTVQNNGTTSTIKTYLNGALAHTGAFSGTGQTWTNGASSVVMGHFLDNPGFSTIRPFYLDESRLSRSIRYSAAFNPNNVVSSIQYNRYGTMGGYLSFVFDEKNKYLGIGTSAPSEVVHIKSGNIKIEGTAGVHGIIFPDATSQTTAAVTYTLPTATASVLGGIKVGSGLSISSSILKSDLSYSSTVTSITNASLTAGKISITHNAGFACVSAIVVDNNGKVVIPDEITNTSTTVAEIDLSSFSPITGTWLIRII